VAAVALIVGLFAAWPIPIGNDGGYDPSVQLLPRGLLRLAPHGGSNLEFTWRGLELVAGNYYVVAAVVFVAAVACGLAVTRRRRPAEAAAEPLLEPVATAR
jgi:alpha-1,2-mannosyltransferase